METGSYYGEERECTRCGDQMYFGVNGSWNHRSGGGSGDCERRAKSTETRRAEMENKNADILKSFVEYCETHPQERFWQALRNWCGWSFVMVSHEKIGNGRDTFYFKDRPE